MVSFLSSCNARAALCNKLKNFGLKFFEVERALKIWAKIFAGVGNEVGVDRTRASDSHTAAGAALDSVTPPRLYDARDEVARVVLKRLAAAAAANVLTYSCR